MQTEVKEHPTSADIQDEDWKSSDTFYYKGKLYQLMPNFSIVEVDDGQNTNTRAAKT